MITFSSRPPKPPRLCSRACASKKAALTRKLNNSELITSDDFDSQYFSHLEIRKPLWLWQRYKCCYCERKRDLKREADVEHFRPKSRIDGVNGPGYYWLAYEWENLFFCCRACNQDFKKSAFPLERGGIRATRSRRRDLVRERPTLPDLERENPEDLIGYRWVLEPEPLATPFGIDKSGRGDRIIRVLGLNRDQLNMERGEIIEDLKAHSESLHLAIQNGSIQAIRRMADRVRNATSANRNFLGFRRFFFRHEGLGDYVAS